MQKLLFLKRSNVSRLPKLITSVLFNDSIGRDLNVCLLSFLSIIDHFQKLKDKLNNRHDRRKRIFTKIDISVSVIKMVIKNSNYMITLWSEVQTKQNHYGFSQIEIFLIQWKTTRKEIVFVNIVNFTIKILTSLLHLCS